MRDGKDLFVTIAVIGFFILALSYCSYIGTKSSEAAEKNYKEAYDEGYEEGKEKGYELGYDDGYGVGYSEGYVAGEESMWEE